MIANFDNISRRGLMLVFSSPSGAGKTSISRALLNRNEKLIMSISVTTRLKRPGELDGKDYIFVNQEGFDNMVLNNDLLEYANVFGKCYGTPRKLVEKNLAQGKDVLFDVDWQGTQQIKRNAGKDLVSIFVLPPSLEALENRLHSRAQDTEDVVRLRMAGAMSEISHWAEYDYIIVNRNLEESIKQAEAILTAERLKRIRRIGLTKFLRKFKV